MKTKILIMMLVSLPVKANCTNIVNLMEPCYTKQYIDSVLKQRQFFKTHKKCTAMKYVKLNEQCPKFLKKGKRK